MQLPSALADPLPMSIDPLFFKRSPTGHKGTYGTVLGIGGSRGMAGAVALAGRASLVSGAGLVRLAVPDPILETAAGYFPELTTIPCPADAAGRFCLSALDSLLMHAAEATVLFLGPGLGRSDDLTQLVPALLRQASKSKPVVVDADAVNAMAAAGIGRIGLPAEGAVILTPHAGEFARISGQLPPPEDAMEQRQAAAAGFAAQFGVILVLKGHQTIITDGKRLSVNTTGNPGMATGGSGDVLTGMIAGLLAQHPAAVFEMVCLAVSLHGSAGDLAAGRLGEQSVTATDILRAVPQAFRMFLNTGSDAYV